MATLFLGQDAAGAGSNGELARIASTALQPGISGGNGGANSNQATGGGQQGSSAAPQSGTGGKPAKASAATDADLPALVALYSGLKNEAGIQLAQARGGARAPAAPPTPAAPATPAKPAAQTNATSPTGGETGAQQATSTSAGAQAAADIEAMQRNYVNLDQNPMAMLHLLLVACSNEFDQTRGDVHAFTAVPPEASSKAANGQVSPYNPFLSDLCLHHDLDQLITATKNLVPLTKELEPAPPVVASTPTRTVAPTTQAAKAPQSQAVTDLQNVLVHQGCMAGPPDGIYGPKTDAALKKYVQRHPCNGPASVGLTAAR